jgi:hypothetical protein
MKSDRLRLVSALNVVTGAGLILFRVSLLGLGMGPEKPRPSYLPFNYALSLPEFMLSLLMIATGVLLLKNRQLGIRLSWIAAGTLIFLGLLNVSFNVQTGVYASSASDLVINGVINAWCVGFGIFAIWNLRKEA